MARWRIYYRMDGDVVVEGPETEEEAREAFYELSQSKLLENTYHAQPEIDDLSYEGE